DSALVPNTLAKVLGLSESGDLSMADLLINYLRSRTALIIFDNCEHLIESCAQLVNLLLTSCEHLFILATSREALRISGETPYRVPSLEIPRSDIESAVDSLAKIESVRLFIERAALTSPGFAIGSQNVLVIAEISQRLDGIPLAIELAASRVNVLTVEQILKRLDDRFNLLTGGLRSALPRHRTLRATIEWSYELLSEKERILFRRLAVFIGGWTLESAEEVCSGGDIASGDVLELLSLLVNKSLVIAEETQNRSRYRMLETIRQYAREKLVESSEEENIHTRHLAYFTKLAEQVEPELYSSNQILWGNKLWDEIGNLRTAMEWALANDIKSGFQLIINLEALWDIRGHIREGEHWLKQLLEHYQEFDSLRARALADFGGILGLTGEPKQAQIAINQGLELSRAISDKSSEALCLWHLGNTIGYQGYVGQSTSILEKSLALYRSLGDKRGQANVMSSLSIINNDIERSKSFLFESLRLYRELEHLAGIAECSDQLASYAIWEGDFSSAIQ
ncbi:MAG TPA: hypothetical protein VK206_02190, partial [Anaerolineales bacterium]|nr:hypothetical protein [Anaerolineales bacterium]